MDPKPGVTRANVWLALYDAAQGLTDAELGVALHPAADWQERRAELALEGVVFQSGHRNGAPLWHARRRNRTPEPETPMDLLPPPPPFFSLDSRPTALLIDGKNLLFRAMMSRGAPVEVDFPQRLAALREQYQPVFAIVAWDADGPTWRHTAYADYKAQRDPANDYEKSVYAKVPGWAGACGFQFVEAPGWEADDIIGTYTTRLRGAHRVVIVSNDKDFAQLLGPSVTMLKGWSEVIGEDDVMRIWGVPPNRIADLLAIMGDTSDNIPGVPKIGEKGAVKLVTEFGGVEEIIAAAKAGRDKARARADRITEHADALRLFKRLTTISCGITGLAAPVPCSLMPPAPQGKRAEMDGMTVLDGVLYPLSETAYMAAQHGWRWTNPTSMPERKQAQLRPGEPLERWERDDHWAYLIERGGQWTLVHRGIEGDGIETGEKHLGTALAAFHEFHALYCAAHANPSPEESWHPLAATLTLEIIEAQRHAKPAQLPQAAPPLAQAPPQALSAADEPTEALGGGTGIELPSADPGSFMRAFGPSAHPLPVDGDAPADRQVEPPTTQAPDMMEVYGLTVADLLPPETPEPSEPEDPPTPYRIPAPDPSKATIPTGYAFVLAAFALEAFTGEPQTLVWVVDLKNDLNGPPDGYLGDPNAFSDGRWANMLAQLQSAITNHRNDPGARAQLGLIVESVAYGPQILPVAVDLDPNRANLAFIAHGEPPAGRFTFMSTAHFDAVVPRLDRGWFSDDIPF